MAAIDPKSDILRASAIVHGQHGNHEKALEIYVHQLKDYDGALRHCIEYSKICSSEKSKREVFHILLDMYMKHNLKDELHKKIFKEEAIKLLNSPLTAFDSIRVLSMIPSEWSVSDVSDFLIKSFRTSHREKFCTSVEKGLLESENKRLQLVQLKNAFEEPYLITGATTCDVCSLPFDEYVGQGDDDYPVENNPFESSSLSPDSIPNSLYSSSSGKSQMETTTKDIVLIPSHNRLIHAKCFHQLDPKYDGNNCCSNSFTSR